VRLTRLESSVEVEYVFAPFGLHTFGGFFDGQKAEGGSD